MKVGIIGYGWVAGAHIEALNAIDGVEVSAVFSSRPQDDHELSEKHGSAITSYTDLDVLLANDDIGAVSICSYPGMHKDHALACAAAGKHMIIE